MARFKPHNNSFAIVFLNTGFAIENPFKGMQRLFVIRHLLASGLFNHCFVEYRLNVSFKPVSINRDNDFISNSFCQKVENSISLRKSFFFFSIFNK